MSHPQNSSALQDRATRWDWLNAVVFGSCLSLGVWWTLACGGGLVGGDTYPYFFPQKQMMKQAFDRGERPLWNDRTGLGYPMHAESQAGLFYPTNQILYRLLDVNRAYNVSILLHYCLAFVFSWRFAKSQGVSSAASMLAALVYVYGWFPARISLEWSIIGGVWLPLSLWLTDRWIRQPVVRNAALLSVAFALHLLAGHFALAFVTQLTCCGYALLKVWLNRDSDGGRTSIPWTTVAGVPAAIVVAVLLASVQLLPTMELKWLSQRHGGGSEFDPGYGHMPPVYLSQLVASWWYWHSPEVVLSRTMTQHPWLSISSATNQVEAHLYFGLLPLAMLLLLMSFRIRHRISQQLLKVWLTLSGLSILYATGWLVPITKHLPGFGYFMGPARYTIVAALGAGILSGAVLDQLLRRKRKGTSVLLVGIACAVTLPDLLKSSEAPVRDAVAVPDAPIDHLQESWIRRYVTQLEEQNIRFLAPGPNVANLYGASCIPQYLGLGPAEYYADEKTYRTRPDNDQPFPADGELSILKERGVTHILATEPIGNPSEAIRLLHAAPDAFLNRVWGRGRQPVYLYALNQPAQRVTTGNPENLVSWKFINRTPSEVEVEVDLKSSDTLIVRELFFPGWKVFVDSVEAVPNPESGFSRLAQVPSGRHVVTWTYQPGSFTAGCSISILTLVALLILCRFTRSLSRPI